MTRKSVAAIILTLNQRERTVACLTSLLDVEDSSFEILVWDNGSTDGTEETIREMFPEVMVHRHSDNLGVASGRNAAALLAIELLDPAYLLFLDNDMVVEPGFVRALYTPFLEDDSVGQTQAKLRFMNDRSRINDGGGALVNFVTWQVTPVGYGEIDDGQHDKVEQCISCGGAMMVRRGVFEALQGFDTTFDPFGPEDLDFSLRLQGAGYKALYVPQAVAYHLVSHTYGKEYGEAYARHKSRHWFTFMRRHATLTQKIGFYVLGAPTMMVRVALREGRRGNLKALRGLFRGAIDYAKSYLYKRSDI